MEIIDFDLFHSSHQNLNKVNFRCRIYCRLLEFIQAQRFNIICTNVYENGNEIYLSLVRSANELCKQEIKHLFAAPFSFGCCFRKSFQKHVFREQQKATKWVYEHERKYCWYCKVRFSNEHVKTLLVYFITEFVGCLCGMANDITGSRE